MCTLIIATLVWQDTPVLVAANRDERLGRPSKAPYLQEHRGMPLLAPRDLRAGGTWLGVNAAGVFAALTNRFTQTEVKGRRSRGLLVLDVLSERSAEAAVQRFEHENPARHAPFHLITADGEGAHLLWNDGAAHHRERLAPGIHVLTERSLGAAPTARIDLIHQKVQQIYGPRRPEPVAWTEILRTQSEPSIEGVCVRDPSRNYGTRSSTIVYLSRRLEDTMLLHADGPPDQTAYADLSSQLRGLLEAQHGENRAMRPSS